MHQSRHLQNLSSPLNSSDLKIQENCSSFWLILDTQMTEHLLFEAIDKGDDILLLEVTKHLNFSQGCLFNDFIVIRLFELFNGD